MREEYANIKTVLERLQYQVHGWLICVNLKMVNILLGQQAGFIKYPCFLCYWEWPPRETLTPGDRNIVREPLVQRENIILPSTHKKLGLIKQFVKELDNDVECFC